MKNRRQRRLERRQQRKARAAEMSSPLQNAAALFQSGKVEQAGDILEKLLSDQPENFDALTLLGVVRATLGDPGAAIPLFESAARIKPGDADIHINLAKACEEQDRFDDAIGHYRRALEIEPNNDAYHINLGNLLKDKNDISGATDCYQRALEINPGNAGVHSNLGNSLGAQGFLDDAVASHRRAIEIDPGNALFHSNLGIALKALGLLDEAVASHIRALEFESGIASIHCNLGNALEARGRLDEAVASYHNALAIKPDYADAHNNLGIALHYMGKQDQAVESYREALAIQPDYAEAYNNLGNAYTVLGRLDEAVASCQKALAIQPDYAEAHDTLGSAFKALDRLDDAVASYQKALAIKPDFSGAGKNILNTLLNLPGLTPKELFTEHLRFSEVHARAIVRMPEDFTHEPDPDRRLRVGYLSSDFHNHPVGTNVLPLISCHDRAKFEIFCYADVARPDAITERFQSCVDHWHSIVGNSDSVVAEKVRADGIDVLVCLAGRFDSNRPLVCAHRAAPVQVSLFDGATSGLEDMDYWLTDDFLHPPETKELFTEELHRLPVLYQYPPLTEAPAVGTLPADRVEFITFGSFNNPSKINDDVIRLWAEVLKSIPGSRMLLKYKNWYDQASLHDHVADMFAAAGIGQYRFKFEAASNTMTEHLGRYGEVDIGLDTFPFNGATTTFQAMWMGVPVVSLAGETFISRMSGSILHQAGLGDLAVDTPEAYVACARELAGDIERLKKLRTELRGRVAASPLCDAPAYALSIETAFRDMWRNWCARQTTHHDLKASPEP